MNLLFVLIKLLQSLIKIRAKGPRAPPGPGPQARGAQRAPKTPALNTWNKKRGLKEKRKRGLKGENPLNTLNLFKEGLPLSVCLSVSLSLSTYLSLSLPSHSLSLSL